MVWSNLAEIMVLAQTSSALLAGVVVEISGRARQQESEPQPSSASYPQDKSVSHPQHKPRSEPVQSPLSG